MCACVCLCTLVVAAELAEWRREGYATRRQFYIYLFVCWFCSSSLLSLLLFLLFGRWVGEALFLFGSRAARNEKVKHRNDSLIFFSLFSLLVVFALIHGCGCRRHKRHRFCLFAYECSAMVCGLFVVSTRAHRTANCSDVDWTRIRVGQREVCECAEYKLNNDIRKSDAIIVCFIWVHIPIELLNLLNFLQLRRTAKWFPADFRPIE